MNEIELVMFLRQHLRLEVRQVPEQFANDPVGGPVHLCLMLGDNVLTAIHGREIQAVLDEKASVYG